MPDSSIIRPPYNYCGLKILENPILTVPGQSEQVKRTLKERLFSRPWRPFKKYIKVTPMIPDPNYYLDKINNTIIAHPDTARKLMNAIEEDTKHG